MTRDELRAYAKQLVADMPPLTPEQRTDLRGLLRPGALAIQSRRAEAAPDLRSAA